jgi:hypothetical protein
MPSPPAPKLGIRRGRAARFAFGAAVAGAALAGVTTLAACYGGPPRDVDGDDEDEVSGGGSSASPATPLTVPAVEAPVGGTTSRGGSQSGDNE